MEGINKDLVENLRDTIESTLSAEENAKRMEDFFLKSRQKEVALNLDTKKKSELHFKVVQELHGIKIKEKNLEAELNGCEATLKNLENRINRLDHESLKQAEVIYGQVGLHSGVLCYECSDFNLKTTTRTLIFNRWKEE